MSEVEGYAVVDEERGILVKTVSDTERAAKINYLVSEQGIMITQGNTNTYINNLFKEMEEKYQIECVRVLIRRA